MIRFFTYFHRILGVLLSGLFLMWFLSGFVMIFHRFPKVSPHERILKQKALSGHLRDMGDLRAFLADTVRLQSISLDMYAGRPVFHLQQKAGTADIYADSLSVLPPRSARDIEQTVKQWNSAAVAGIDTLWKSDQWLMPRKLGKDVPVYKYRFADEEKHQLYISSQTGHVLQYTDKNQRFWAWLGAIPHWVYFTSLRENQQLWSDFVKWTSGIGSIMCLAGIIIGIRVLRKTRSRKFRSPYKKYGYRLHYISGLFFGVFAMTFAFSGMMSMMDLPDWMKKKPKNIAAATTAGESAPRGMRPARELNLAGYMLDYRLLLESIENIKHIEWAEYLKKPYYKVTTDEETYHVDASEPLAVRPFVLTEEMIHSAVKQMHGGEVAYSIDWMEEHDQYYYNGRKSKAPLPVYRVILDDELHTRYYYNPQTLSQRRTDDNSRLRHFLYGGLHSLNFRFLTDRPVLWNIVMFTLLAGGTLLSFTGVLLSVKWIKRKIKKTVIQYTNKSK